MDHDVGGWKPSQYSDAAARIILARIEAGESVASLLADPAMPSRRTLYDWIRDWPDFGEAWRQMRADQARARRAAAAAAAAAPIVAADLGRIEPRGAAGRAARARCGRKSTYSDDRGLAICLLIEWGHTLREALAWAGVGSLATFYRWLRHHPALREAYMDAARRREQALQGQRDAVILCLDWRAGPEGNAHLKTQIDRLQARIAAVRPDVWRWD